MNARGYRAGMLAGSAFALLLFFGATQMFSSTPDTSNKSADEVSRLYAKWLTDSSNRTQAVIGSFLVVLAAIALIWFASTMRSRLAAGNTPLLPFAVLAAASAIASMAGPLTLIGGNAFGDDPLPTDGEVIWIVFSLAFPLLLVAFSIASSAFIATVVVVGRGVLPMWLIVFGWIAVVAGIFGVEFLPLGIVLLWYLAAGIYGAMRPGAPEATTPAVTTPAV
jgi:hypothetical protein